MKLSDKDQPLFEDNHLLIVNKEVNIPTQPSDKESISLVGLWKDWLKKKEQKNRVFLEPIHRLDKVVSGIVIFAKTSKALKRLHAQLREKKMRKTYVAEVEGRLVPKKAILIHFLQHKNFYSKIVDMQDKDAKKAELSYIVKKYTKTTTLVQIELISGRYHQIRAQFSHIGHAIVGDEKYGGHRAKKKGIKLHHCRICFIHPVTQKEMEILSIPYFYR